MTDNEVLGEATKRGLLDVTKETEEKKEPEKEKFDLEALMEKMTPEQREWVKLIKQINQQELKEVKEELAKYQEKFGDMDTREKAKELGAIETKAKEMVEKEYKLDWEKDVLPEMKKIIPEIF